MIWRGDLRWYYSDRHEPDCDEFDWVIDYLENSTPTQPTDPADDETEGNALLALSAMRGLGSAAKRPSCIRARVHCIDLTRPPRVRHAALRVVSDAQDDLVSSPASRCGGIILPLTRATNGVDVSPAMVKLKKFVTGRFGILDATSLRSSVVSIPREQPCPRLVAATHQKHVAACTLQNEG